MAAASPAGSADFGGEAEPAALQAEAGGAYPAPTPRERLGVRAILLLAAALLLHAAWRVGPTYDEHFYLTAGYSYWEHGEFGLNREHPPLLKLLFGLPLRFVEVVHPPWAPRLLDYPAAFVFQLNAEHWQRNLFLARLPACAATLLLAWALHRRARRLFGPSGGFVSLLLFAFNPTVLAHGPLAALDMGVAVFLFLAACAFGDVLRESARSPRAGTGGAGPRRILLAGVLFGLANGAKFTALILGPAYALATLAAALRARSAKPLAALLGVFLVGLTVFAALYRFEARSVASVWANPLYAKVGAGEGRGLAQGRLAEAGEQAGLERAVVERLRAAPDGWRAAEQLFLRLDQAAPDEQRLLLRALEPLAEAPEEWRKEAFARVLALALDPGAEAGRLVLLGRLAGLELSSLEAFQAWYEAYRRSGWDRVLFTQPALRALTRGLLGDERPIPLLTALKGLDYQLDHGSSGHGTVFRGHVLMPADFSEGNPYPEYYLVVLGVKLPLASLLAMGLGTLLWALGRGPRDRLERAFLLLLPLALLALFCSGRALLGIKYLIPILPFWMLAAGAVGAWRPRLGIALAVVAALEGVWMHPHHLMYYNALAGGPRGGPAITVVGDDWGQGVVEVGRFVERHGAQIEAAGGLWYNPFTRGDRRAFGLEKTRPFKNAPQGIVAVHAIQLEREPARYGAFRDFEPFAILGHSVYLYDTRVPPPGGNPLEDWRAQK